MSYYILSSGEISCIRASIRVENQYDDFVNVMQDSIARFHLFRFYIHFIRQLLIGSSHKALWEIHTNFCLTTMQFTRISSIRICVIVRICWACYYIFFGFWRCLFQILFVTSNACRDLKIIWGFFSNSENNIFDIFAVLV